MTKHAIVMGRKADRLLQPAIGATRFLISSCRAAILRFRRLSALGGIWMWLVEHPQHIERLIVGHGIADADVHVGERLILPPLQKIPAAGGTHESPGPA